MQCQKGMDCTYSATSEGKLDGVKVSNRAPHFSNETFLGHINVAEVQGVVDGFHFADLYKPDTDVLRSCLQDPLPMILCLVQHLPEEMGMCCVS